MAENTGAPSTTTCDSWDEFCAAIRIGEGRPFNAIFRGQGDHKWPLVPPSARGQFEQAQLAKNAGAVKTKVGSARRGDLDYFKHLATALHGVDLSTLKEIDIEALARHHGFTSNLLDWTTSPYVAAFFAFTSVLDLRNKGRLLGGTLNQHSMILTPEPVCIWRLGIRDDLWVTDEFDELSSLSNVNYWQKAQAGVFTRLTHEDHIDVCSYLAERGLLAQLDKFLIPGTEAWRALSDLETMNITYASLFPDLRGAAIQANIGATWRLLGRTRL